MIFILLHVDDVVAQKNYKRILAFLAMGLFTI